MEQSAAIRINQQCMVLCKREIRWWRLFLN